jgi:hypothetical protein
MMRYPVVLGITIWIFVMLGKATTLNPLTKPEQFVPITHPALIGKFYMEEAFKSAEEE